MPAVKVKTNERPGTRAVLRQSHMSAYKAREVLDLIRNKPVGEALETLRLCGRDAAIPIAKLLASAVANAEHNDQQDPDELYVSTAFADESTTMKRWRPRARGRATRIRKRTCHVTLVVSRLPEDKIARLVARKANVATDRRSRRVAASRRTGESELVVSPESAVLPEAEAESAVLPEAEAESAVLPEAEAEAGAEAGAEAEAEAESGADENQAVEANAGNNEEEEPG